MRIPTENLWSVRSLSIFVVRAAVLQVHKEDLVSTLTPNGTAQISKYGAQGLWDWALPLMCPLAAHSVHCIFYIKHVQKFPLSALLQYFSSRSPSFVAPDLV